MASSSNSTFLLSVMCHGHLSKLSTQQKFSWRKTNFEMMSQSSDRNMFLLVCDGLVVEISTMDRRQDSTFVHFTSFLLVAFPFNFLQQRLLSKYIYYMMFYHSLNVHVMSLCPCPSTSTLSMHIHVM